MGMRSPQQIEKNQIKKVQPNQAKAGVIEDTSLSSAVQAAQAGYDTGYKMGFIQERKKAKAKINIQNKVDQVSKAAEATLASFKGQEVNTKFQQLKAELDKAYEKIKQETPKEYEFEYFDVVDKAQTSVYQKYLTKFYTEENKLEEERSNANIKTRLDEASNKISFIRGLGAPPSDDPYDDSFESKLKNLEKAVEDKLIAKGYDPNSSTWSAVYSQQVKELRSKALLQGIETFAASKRMDMLDFAKNAFKAYGNNPQYMTAEDRESALKALNAGEQSAKGEIAYQLANEAMTKLPRSATLQQKLAYINSKALSTDITSRANAQVTALHNAEIRAYEEDQVNRLNIAGLLLRQGKLDEAASYIKTISDAETHEKATNMFNSMNMNHEGGFMTDPTTYKLLMQSYLDNPETFHEKNLDGLPISRADRDMFEAKKMISAKKRSDSRYAIFTGQAENDAINKAMDSTNRLMMQRGEVLTPYERAENAHRYRQEYYKVIQENPNEFNKSVIERIFLDRVYNMAYKKAPNKVFGVDVPTWVPWLGKEKTVPNEDFGAKDIPVTEDEIQRIMRKSPNSKREDVIRAIRNDKKKRQMGGN